jgi:hypothetical protein
MDFKTQASEFLTLHGFEQGKTVNTKDWYTNKSQEIRLGDNSFSHHRNRNGFLVPTDYPKADIKMLENVIFLNGINGEFLRRLHSAYAVVYAPKIIRKRKAKRVEKFEKVA